VAASSEGGRGGVCEGGRAGEQGAGIERGGVEGGVRDGASSASSLGARFWLCLWLWLCVHVGLTYGPCLLSVTKLWPGSLALSSRSPSGLLALDASVPFRRKAGAGEACMPLPLLSLAPIHPPSPRPSSSSSPNVRVCASVTQGSGGSPQEQQAPARKEVEGEASEAGRKAGEGGAGGQGERSGKGVGKRGKLAKGYADRACDGEALVEAKDAVERNGPTPTPPRLQASDG
jgi:hypothetical protein